MTQSAFQSASPVASALRTTSSQTSTIRNNGFDTHLFFIDVTAVAGGGAVVVTIQRQDPLSLKWFDVLASASISAVGTAVLQIGPEFAAAANLSANTSLSENYRIAWAITGTSVTFSVGSYSK